MRVTSILKKGDDSTKKIFKEYLESNKIWVFPEKLTHEMYKIREPYNSGEIKNDYFVYRLLNNSVDKIINPKEYFKFLLYCLNNNHHDILLSQLIIKTPKTNDPLFNDYLLDILNLLSSKEDILFNFVNRSSFLNSSWIYLQDFLVHIQNKNHIKDIFRTLIKTTAFSSSDNQKEIFSLLLSTKIDHQDLIPFFNKLKITEHLETPIISVNTQKSIILTVSKKDLISVNLQNNLGSSLLISTILEHLNYIRINFSNLKISKIFIDYDKSNQNYNIYTFCAEEEIGLVAYLLEKVILLIATQKDLDSLKLLTANYSLFLKEQSSQYMYMKLNQKISKQLENKRDSNKI